jgi:hypothetical protein
VDFCITITHREYTSLVVQQFLAGKSIPVIIQPPYSPDLAQSEFWLFPTLKMGLKGTRFATMGDIKSNATAEFRKIPKRSLPPVLLTMAGSMCVRAQGSYFEGDKGRVVVCPNITVLYHISGNFLTAHRTQKQNTKQTRQNAIWRGKIGTERREGQKHKTMKKYKFV